MFKLTEFCERILSDDPYDLLALLTVTAMTVLHTGEFKRGRWSQLRNLNAVSVEWIIFAAMYMEICGADDSQDFAEFVITNEIGTEVVPPLGRVSK